MKLVTATVGKDKRAAPVAMLFEAGQVALHWEFPELEAELVGMIAGGDYEEPGNEPRPGGCDGLGTDRTHVGLRTAAAAGEATLRRRCSHFPKAIGVFII